MLPSIGVEKPLTPTTSKAEDAKIRANVELFVDAIMENKYSIGELLNESFSMEMLELLLKRMTSKLRSMLFARKMILELIRVALDSKYSHHTRVLATSFIVVGNAASCLTSCMRQDHKCMEFWQTTFEVLEKEATATTTGPDAHATKSPARVPSNLEELLEVAVRDIMEDGIKSMKSSFAVKEEEEEDHDEDMKDHKEGHDHAAENGEGDEHMVERLSEASSLRSSVHSSDLPDPEGTVPENFVNDVTPPMTLTNSKLMGADTANFASQIIQYFAVRVQKGACIMHYLAENQDKVDLLLANIAHDDIHTLLLHLMYSDHSEDAIQSLFASCLMEKMVQKLLSFPTPQNSVERDTIENIFLLLREILHAPYLTPRGVAISAKTIPIDKITGQEEYVSICGASREMANSSMRKYTSRKVRHLVHLFMRRSEHPLEQLFQQMIRELTFWSSPEAAAKASCENETDNKTYSLLSQGHPRPACTTMLMHLFELTESLDVVSEATRSGVTSVGIDCLNFMCSTHMVKTGNLFLKRKLKNEVQACMLSMNCMLGLRITSLRAESNSSTEPRLGDASLVASQKGGYQSVALDDIESVESSDWHQHGFSIHVVRRPKEKIQIQEHRHRRQISGVSHRSNSSSSLVNRLNQASGNLGHKSMSDPAERTVEYFAAKTAEEKEKWMNAIQAAISGDLNELEVFCSDDWRSNVREYKQLRDHLIISMERSGHELAVFLRQAVLLGTRNVSGYHLWTICKLLNTVVAIESKRLDLMFVNSRLYRILITCYEKYSNHALLLKEITKLLSFYFADANAKRSRKCPVVERLCKSAPEGHLLPLMTKVFAPEDKDAQPFLAGTDAYANLKLLFEVIRECYKDPKTRSQERVGKLLREDKEWKRLVESTPHNSSSLLLLPPPRPSSIVRTSSGSGASSGATTPSQPAFQDDIISQISRPAYSSAYGWGSSFLLGDGCAFGYMYKKREETSEWMKALVVYEYVSYKMWYFYPSEVDERHEIRWKWIVPLTVKARYVHGQDENHSSIGHHGLWVTSYDQQTNNSTQSLYFSMSKLEDRDAWREVLEKAANTIQQLSQDYSQMSIRLKKPNRKIVTRCQDPTCNVPFKLFRRPHACRRCGKWLCGKCSNYRKSIPEVGLMTPVRHCSKCFEATGGAKSEVEPIKLFLNTPQPSRDQQRDSDRSLEDGESGNRNGNGNGTSNGHGNMELYELAHGTASPHTIMLLHRRCSRQDSIDSPTNGYAVDEIDGESFGRVFFPSDPNELKKDEELQ